MKVSLTNESKKLVTVAQMPAVRAMIAQLAEDNYTAADYAAMVAGLPFGKYCEAKKIYDAKASIAKNCRAYNNYADDSEDLDVWIEFTAYTTEGFAICGVYLSDIWTLSAENKDDVLAHMYVQKFLPA